MKRILLLPLIFSISINCYSQKRGQEKADSLLKELVKMQADTGKMLALLNLSNTYYAFNPDAGIEFADKALDLARELNNPAGIFKSYNFLAANNAAKGNFTKALEYFNNALVTANNAPLPSQKGPTYVNLGVIYTQIGDYPKALENYFKAEKEFEQYQTSKASTTLNTQNIGVTYVHLGNLEKAIGYITKAIELAKANNLSTSLAQSYSNLATVYSKQKNFPKAIEAYNNAYIVSDSMGDLRSKIAITQNIGINWKDQNNLQKASEYFQKALKENLALKDALRTASIEQNIADLYVEEYKKAPVDSLLPNANKFLHEAIGINVQAGLLNELKDNYLLLSKVNELQKKPDSALAILQKAIQIKDSIYNSDNKQTIKNLEDKREIELRDKQIQIDKLSISDQNRKQWMYIGGIGLLAVIGGLLFWQTSNRKKANNKLQVLNTQLDEANITKTRFFGILSHDLRSPMATLINFLHLQKDAPEMMEASTLASYRQKTTSAAENLLATMEDLLLWSKGQMQHLKPLIKPVAIDGLFQEMRLLYPDTPQLKILFSNKEQININTDINYLKTILRNLTTNAIKAVAEKPNGLIEWKAWQENENIFLSITDNGQGMTENQQKEIFSDAGSIDSKNGLGLYLVKDMAAAIHCKLATQYGKDGGITFILQF